MPDDAWAKLHTAIWEDAELAALSSDAFRLFVFSFTHDHYASITGLSVVSERRLARVLSGDMARVEPVLEELGHKPFVRYDYDAELLWAVRRPLYVAPGSARWKPAAQRILRRLPDSPLIDEFRVVYAQLLA